MITTCFDGGKQFWTINLKWMINGNLSFQNANSRVQMVTTMISQWELCNTEMVIISLDAVPIFECYLVVKLMPANDNR